MSYSPKIGKRARAAKGNAKRKKDSDFYPQSIHSLRLFDTDQLKMAKWKSDHASDALPYAIFDRGQVVAIANEGRTAELLMLALWARRIVTNEVGHEFQLLKKRIGNAL